MRLVWRFSRNKRLVCGVLLFLLSLIFIWALFGSTAVDQSLNENDVFYDDARHAHFFVVDHAQPYQRTVEDPVEFIPNRKKNTQDLLWRCSGQGSLVCTRQSPQEEPKSNLTLARL